MNGSRRPAALASDHRAREHMDPFALRKKMGKPPPASAPLSPEQEELVAEFKARHYAA